MKIAAIFILVTTLASSSWAESSDPLVGTWIMMNPRTVIGTGPTDTEINITGRSNSYFVTYSFGGISVQRFGDRQIFKSVTTSYWRIPLKKTGDIYSFVSPEDHNPVQMKLMEDNTNVLPEGDKIIQFRLKNDILELVSYDEKSTHGMFSGKFIRKSD